jgi:hypothetical protein
LLIIKKTLFKVIKKFIANKLITTAAAIGQNILQNIDFFAARIKAYNAIYIAAIFIK